MVSLATVETFSLSRFAPKRSATFRAKLDSRAVKSEIGNVIISFCGETSTDVFGFVVGAGAGGAQKPSAGAL